MAGTILRLVPLQLFDFSNMADGSSMTFVAADYIDLSGWKEGQLVGRAHAGTSIGTGASINFNLYGIDPAPDDPSQVFETESAIASGTVSFDDTASAGTMVMQPLNEGFGLLGRLKITFDQAPSATSMVLYGSVDLVLKTDG